MDSIEFKHLILDLKTTLNGDEEFFGSVRYLRYLSILAFASIAENFKEEGMNKNGILYFNLYTLQKIADFLGFKFDRTRSARTVLEDSVKRGESQKILDDKGVTHYSLTKNGLKSSQTRLLELYEITSSKLLPLEIGRAHV